MRQLRGGVTIKVRLKFFLIISSAVVLLDQVTKAAVVRAFQPDQAVEITRFFSLVYFRNPGAAFGIFNDGGALRTVFLLAVTIAALVVIVILLRQAKDGLMSFALSLIAGGAVGNLIDRVRFGWVIDFLYFYIRPYYWPAFNVADSAITIGVILGLYSYYFRGERD